MNHRVAILGGSGFIGRYIVKRLAERGDVVAVGGRYAAQAKFLKLKGDVGQVGLINIGIDDERLLPAFLAGNDTVINCVGILRESGRQRFDLVHHTAPAREMPNTQLNATGSLADKIATLSPAAMPERSSAPAICRDSCWTSP